MRRGKMDKSMVKVKVYVRKEHFEILKSFMKTE